MADEQLDRTLITAFLEGYGEALATGDLTGISGCYEEPAFLLSARGGRLLTRAGIESDFDGAADRHREAGLVGARPAIVAYERLTDDLVSVDVHWDYVDADDHPLVEDGYRYVLRLADGPDARPRICTVVPTPDRLRRPAAG